MWPQVPLTAAVNLAGANNTSGQFADGIIDTDGAIWIATIFANFWAKNPKSGAWGKMINEKDLRKKSRDTVPVKCNFC